MKEQKFLFLYRIEDDDTCFAILTAGEIFSFMELVEKSGQEVSVDVYLLNEYGERPTRCSFMSRAYYSDFYYSMAILGPDGILAARTAARET
jgi:hypothetical protein